MPHLLDNLARELRAAVLAVDHENAVRLIDQYTEALRDLWMSMSARERGSSPLPKQSLELLNWVREMTIMQQAMASQHLSFVESASRYQTARAQYLRTAQL